MTSTTERSGAARRGFTITETVVSLMLLVMVMAGTYAIIVRAAKLSRAARDHYIAITLAKNRLERCRTFAYEDLSLLAEQSTVVDDNGTPDVRGRFRRSTLVNTNYVASGTTVLTRILVTVEVRSRKSGRFDGQNEKLESLFTKYREATP